METINEQLSFVKDVVDLHDKYWADQKSVMENLTSIYNTKFFKNHKGMHGSTMIEVETADAYGYVESIIGSLFVRAPAIQIDPDPLQPGGDVQALQELVNRFLDRKAKPIQDACRIGLIYPCSFMKLAPKASSDPLESVMIKAIHPWDVIVDREADEWKTQRFVGHRYFMNYKEAKERFRRDSWNPVDKIDYFENPRRAFGSSRSLKSMRYVQIVEFYNLISDKLYFWSPQFKDGNEFIEITKIPLTDYDGTPLAPIVPLYFGSNPSCPLEGYSALFRVYDQLVEKNLLRTRMANAIRRDGRQFLYNKDKIDELALTGLSLGQDGVLIPVEGDLSGVVQPVQMQPVNSNHDRYLAEIESDLARGTIMAPFTRGEATRATATEVNLLQMYASSEIGRQARSRDEAIESIANIYIRMLNTMLDEEEPITIVVDGAVKILKPEELDGKHVIAALDQANSPIADALKQQQLTTIGPLLVQLGADPAKIREEIVRAYRLPQVLSSAPKPQEVPEVPTGAPTGGLTEAQLRVLMGEAAAAATEDSV